MTDEGHVLFAPHQDDETLFAAFVCCRYRPRIFTVLRGFGQEHMGITYGEREIETRSAAAILGCDHEQWLYPDTGPDWEQIENRIRKVAANTGGLAFAPLAERGGHEQHNLVSEIVRAAFGSRARYYATYRYGGPKTTTGTLVEPEPAWIIAKLRALACYRSQIERGPRRFFLHDLHEYLSE
jgi:LmbE family N-acetylglucosaminyl deacetylase